MNNKEEIIKRCLEVLRKRGWHNLEGNDQEFVIRKAIEDTAQEIFEDILKVPYDRDSYIEQWKEHFLELNKRKPKPQEVMSFKVGFNGGIDLMKSRVDKEKKRWGLNNE